MFGNYPVNDDWVFVRQVEAFNQGIIKLNAEIDPSFVVQGLLGFVWSRLFGANFLSLQILTVIITLLGLWGFIEILKYFKVNKRLVAVSGLLFIFNPLIFSSAFSFMTDNYFLTFMILAVFFLLKYEQTPLYADALFGAVLVLMAALVRQVGIFTGLAFFIGLIFEKYFIKEAKSRKVSTAVGFTLGAAVVLGLLIPAIWPDFGSNRLFILAEQIPGRIKLWLLSWHYYPLFIFPLLLGLGVKMRNVREKAAFYVFFSIFLIFLYNFDIFPVGNVLYLEDLHTKSDFRSNFSLFDNVFFKLGLSALVSLAFTKLTFFVKGRWQKKDVKWEKQDVFLMLLVVMNCLVLLVTSDFYDRYLLPAFVCFFLLFVKKFSKFLRLNWYVIATTILFTFISVVLQWEFSSKNRLKWEQSKRLMEETGYVRQIELNDTYIDYIATQQQNDFTGLIERKGAYDKVCYIQEYTLDSNCQLLEAAQRIEDVVDRNLIPRKKPYNVLKKNIPRAKNNLDKMIYNQRYFSFLYDLVGKEAYVGSWCLE